MSSGHNRTPGGRRPGPVLQPERQGRPHRVPGPPAGGFLFLPASRRDGVRLSGDGGLGLRGAPPSLPNDPRRHASRRSSLSSGTERGGAEPPRRGWARRPGADAQACSSCPVQLPSNKPPSRTPGRLVTVSHCCRAARSPRHAPAFVCFDAGPAGAMFAHSERVSWCSGSTPCEPALN